MSDNVKIALIVATGPTLIGLIGMWVNWLNGRKLEAVHTLVNSGATEQLKIGMISAKALAVASPTSENVELAAVAQDKYHKSVMANQTK